MLCGKLHIYKKAKKEGGPAQLRNILVTVDLPHRGIFDSPWTCPTAEHPTHRGPAQPRKKILTDYSKSFLLCTQKSPLLKKGTLKSTFWRIFTKKKCTFLMLNKVNCSQKYFLSNQKSALVKKKVH